MPTNSHVLSHRQLVVKSVKMALSNSKAGDCMDRASSHLIFQIHQHLSNHQNQEPVDLLLLLGQAISLMAVNIGFGFRWKTEDLNSKVEGRDILDSSERIFDLLQVRSFFYSGGEGVLKPYHHHILPLSAWGLGEFKCFESYWTLLLLHPQLQKKKFKTWRLIWIFVCVYL